MRHRAEEPAASAAAAVYTCSAGIRRGYFRRAERLAVERPCRAPGFSLARNRASGCGRDNGDIECVENVYSYRQRTSGWGRRRSGCGSSSEEVSSMYCTRPRNFDHSLPRSPPLHPTSPCPSLSVHALIRRSVFGDCSRLYLTRLLEHIQACTTVAAYPHRGRN